MRALFAKSRVSRFAAIGVLATGLYAVLAFLLERTLLQPAAASVAAYALAACFSYAGHKYVTFRSPGEHRAEAPRFLFTTAVGLFLSWLVPTIVVGRLGAPPLAAYLGLTVAVPVINYVLLVGWVFASRGSRR